VIFALVHGCSSLPLCYIFQNLARDISFTASADARPDFRIHGVIFTEGSI
jgi:hypothetical protein